MALQFFKECVDLNLVDDLPAPFSVKDTDSLPQPSSTSQPLPPRAPSQAFRNPSQPTSSPHSASQHQHTSASLAASHRPSSHLARQGSQQAEHSPQASGQPSAKGVVSQPATVHNPLLPHPSSSLRCAVNLIQPPASMQGRSSSQPSKAVCKPGQNSKAADAAHAPGQNPLLPHPSSCYRAAQDTRHAGNPDASASQQLAYNVAASQQPMAAPTDLEDDVDDADVSQVMEFATCSHAKARKVCLFVQDLHAAQNRGPCQWRTRVMLCKDPGIPCVRP